MKLFRVIKGVHKGIVGTIDTTYSLITNQVFFYPRESPEVRLIISIFDIEEC
jgi:hypothetical protein